MEPEKLKNHHTGAIFQGMQSKWSNTAQHLPSDFCKPGHEDSYIATGALTERLTPNHSSADVIRRGGGGTLYETSRNDWQQNGYGSGAFDELSRLNFYGGTSQMVPFAEAFLGDWEDNSLQGEPKRPSLSSWNDPAEGILAHVVYMEQKRVMDTCASYRMEDFSRIAVEFLEEIEDAERLIPLGSERVIGSPQNIIPANRPDALPNSGTNRMPFPLLSKAGMPIARQVAYTIDKPPSDGIYGSNDDERNVFEDCTMLQSDMIPSYSNVKRPEMNVSSEVRYGSQSPDSNQRLGDVQYNADPPAKEMLSASQRYQERVKNRNIDDILNQCCSAVTLELDFATPVAAMVKEIKQHRENLVNAQTFSDIAYGCLGARSKSLVIQMLFDVRLASKIPLICGDLQEQEILELIQKIPFDGCESGTLVEFYKRGQRWLFIIRSGTFYCVLMLIALGHGPHIQTISLERLKEICASLFRPRPTQHNVGQILIPAIVALARQEPLTTNFLFPGIATQHVDDGGKGPLCGNPFYSDLVFNKVFPGASRGRTRGMAWHIAHNIWVFPDDQKQLNESPRTGNVRHTPMVLPVTNSTVYYRDPSSSATHTLKNAHAGSLIVEITNRDELRMRPSDGGTLWVNEAHRASSRNAQHCSSVANLLTETADNGFLHTLSPQSYIRFVTASLSGRTLEVKSPTGHRLLSVVTNVPDSIRTGLYAAVHAASDWQIDSKDTQDEAIRQLATGQVECNEPQEIQLPISFLTGNATHNVRWWPLKAILEAVIVWYKAMASDVSVSQATQTPFDSIRLVQNAANAGLMSAKAVLVATDCATSMIFPSLLYTVDIGPGQMVVIHSRGLEFLAQHFNGRAVFLLLG